ncbi:hypothetical protein Tco_1171425 [Tanacetum coccineum]
MGVMAKNKKKTKGEICPIVTNGASTGTKGPWPAIISGLYTSRLLDAACTSALNLLNKGLFDTLAGNPVKEILLKLNLPDHRPILTDSKEYVKMVMEVPDSS